MNTALLTGRIANEPELKTTSNGNSLLKLRLEVNEPYRRGGEFHDRKSWHTVVVWGERGNELMDQLGIGTLVHVQGRITNRQWETSTGEKRTSTEINARDVTPLGAGAPAVGERVERDARGEGVAQAQAIMNTLKGSSAPAQGFHEFSDDIPF